MKLAALVRSFNEEANIEIFCKSYAEFCDVILVADGGSTDNTVSIAQSMPKTIVRNYPIKVECANGIWRNPDGPHLNFLYEWAEEEGADWVVSQDCDQRPNKYLKQQARSIMENTKKDFIVAAQIFLWKGRDYFPHMVKCEYVHPQLPALRGQWAKGLWAWRTRVHLRAIDKMPHFEFTLDGKTSVDFNLPGLTEPAPAPPCCFMHFGWPDDEKVARMIKYYKDSKLIPTQAHPLQFGGPLAPIEAWMVE